MAMPAIGTVLFYVSYPVILLLKWLLVALTIISAPILHLGYFLLHAMWVPFRLLGKFETLYIYFGVAVVVGVVTGALLHYLASFIVAALGMDRATERRGRTLASYRVEKASKQSKSVRKSAPKLEAQSAVDLVLKEEYPEWLKQDRKPSRGGLLSTTILEEEDSSDVGI